MSCGKCPADLFRPGPSSGMRSYGGRSSYGMCGPSSSQIAHYLRQTQTQSNYGQQTKMKSQYLARRNYGHTTNYVIDLYTTTAYASQAKLEDKVEHKHIPVGLEAKLELAPQDLELENEKIIDLAQKIAEKRRSVQQALAQFKEKETA